MDSLSLQNANLNGMFQNSQYNFNREERKTLIIECQVDSSNVEKNVLKLYEPLIIDKLSDVYLESFSTFNASLNTSMDTMAFIINIEEFNIKTNCNRNASLSPSASGTLSYTYNNIVIPNETNASGTLQIHKSKKLNYICSINPTRLNQLTIQVTDLNNKSIFLTDNDNDCKYILELVIVSRE